MNAITAPGDFTDKADRAGTITGMRTEPGHAPIRPQYYRAFNREQA